MKAGVVNHREGETGLLLSALAGVVLLGFGGIPLKQRHALGQQDQVCRVGLGALGVTGSDAVALLPIAACKGVKNERVAGALLQAGIS